MQLRPILTFTAQKLLRLGLLLLAVAIFTFVLLSLSPIDPVQAYIGADMMRISPEQQQLIAERWGLDQPMAVRFWDWLGQLLQGNWGTSMVFNQPVGEVIAKRFWVSVQMLAIAWLLSGTLGLGLGILSGALAGSWIDRVIRLYAYTVDVYFYAKQCSLLRSQYVMTCLERLSHRWGMRLFDFIQFGLKQGYSGIYPTVDFS